MVIGILLSPLELIYGAGLRVKNARYARREAARLSWPVISVGNLSVGGTGKTPLVILLAQLLADRGFMPDVLSRGYGRKGTAAERVRTDSGADDGAEKYGDEPVLISNSTGVPVFVGASRYAAGMLAELGENNPSRHLHLLDDGFQHRELGRAIDIVLVHRDDLKDRLLPVGRLREPLSSLKRAHIVVLREEDTDLEPRLRRYTRRECLFWRIRRRLILGSPGRRSLAFCAIGRPAEFFRQLSDAGVEIGARMSFRDHHRYTAEDVAKLIKLFSSQKCREFITTEKDAVRLNANFLVKLTSLAPLRIARLSVEIEDEEKAIRSLEAMLA